MFTPWDTQSQALQTGWLNPVLGAQQFQGGLIRDQIAYQRQQQAVQQEQAFRASEAEKGRVANAAIAAQQEKAAAERIALSSRLSLQAKQEEARQQQVEIARQMGAKIADDATYEEAAGAVQKAAGRGYSQAIKDLKDASVNSAGLLNSPQHQALYNQMVARSMLADPNVTKYMTDKQVQGLSNGTVSIDDVIKQMHSGDWGHGFFSSKGMSWLTFQNDVNRAVDTAKLTASQNALSQLAQLPDIANSPQHLEVMRQMQEALGRGQLYSAYLKDPTEYANAVADAAGYTPKAPEVTTPRGTAPAGATLPLPPTASGTWTPPVNPTVPMYSMSPTLPVPVGPNTPNGLGGIGFPNQYLAPVQPVQPQGFTPALNFGSRPTLTANQVATLIQNQAVANQAQGGPVAPAATNPGAPGLPLY